MIATPRLILRAWKPADRAPFAAMNADPLVMRHFPAPLAEDETGAMLDRIESHFATHGFGVWAAELRSAGEFIGFIGLNVPRFEAHFTPCVEIGWRLAAAHWNKGLATEGAAAILQFAFDSLALDEIVSFTTAGNSASRRVMEKLGMIRDPREDFDHPSLPEGHPQRLHVLYRIHRPASAR